MKKEFRLLGNMGDRLFSRCVLIRLLASPVKTLLEQLGAIHDLHPVTTPLLSVLNLISTLDTVATTTIQSTSSPPCASKPTNTSISSGQAHRKLKLLQTVIAHRTPAKDGLERSASRSQTPDHAARCGRNRSQHLRQMLRNVRWRRLPRRTCARQQGFRIGVPTRIQARRTQDVRPMDGGQREA